MARSTNWKKYSELDVSGKTARGKRAEATDMLQEIAGSCADARLLASDIVGHDNKTTALLVQAFNECEQGSSEHIRMQKVALLYPLRSLPFTLIKSLGFNVGKDLWHTVQSYNPFLFQEACKSSSLSGRKKAPETDEVKKAWLSVSHETSTDKMLFYGTRKQAALQVRRATRSKFTTRTILNYRPRCVIFTSKPTDLCPICVQLKRLQKSLSTQTSSDLSGMRVQIQKKINILLRHKKCVSGRRSFFSNLFKNGPPGSLTMCIDWCSPVKVTSVSGTSDEYYKPSFCQMIGAHASYKSPDGTYKTAYVHAYGPVGVYSSKDAAFTCNVTFFLVRKVFEVLCSVPPTSINMWFDTARHFKNKIMLHELPSAIFREFSPQEITISYHCSHHGKTSLDGSFRRGQSWVEAMVDLEGLDKGLVTQKKVFSDAYQAQETVGDYRVFFYPVGNPWACRQLIAPRVSDIERVTYKVDNTASILYEDGSTIPFKKFSTKHVSKAPKPLRAMCRVSRGKCYVKQVKKKFSIV